MRTANLCRWLFLTSGNTQRLFYVNIFRLFVFSGVVFIFQNSNSCCLRVLHNRACFGLPIIYYAKFGLDIKLFDIAKSQLAPILTSLCAVIIPFAIWTKLNSDNLLLFITLVPFLYLSCYVLLTIRQKFIQEFIANTGIIERLKNLNFLNEIYSIKISYLSLFNQNYFRNTYLGFSRIKGFIAEP